MLRYFIPDKKITHPDQVTPALLAEYGLSHAATKWPALNPLEAAGPSGTIGTVIVFHEADKPAGRAEVGYFPDKQDWVKCAGGKYWCGKGKDERITPEALLRSDAGGGYPVVLGDGNEWLIPEALYGTRTQLPRKIVIDENGIAKPGEVIARYRELDQKARAFWMEHAAAIDAERKPEFFLSDLTDLSIVALQCNYRIGKHEACNLLGLLEEENIWGVCEATVSWHRLMAMAEAKDAAEKKTESASTPTG